MQIKEAIDLLNRNKFTCPEWTDYNDLHDAVQVVTEYYKQTSYVMDKLMELGHLQTAKGYYTYTENKGR
jgi:beta-xylosidase